MVRVSSWPSARRAAAPAELGALDAGRLASSPDRPPGQGRPRPSAGRLPCRTAPERSLLPPTVPSWAPVRAGRCKRTRKILPRDVLYWGAGTSQLFLRGIIDGYVTVVFGTLGGVMRDFDPHKYLLDPAREPGVGRGRPTPDLRQSREWRLLDAGRITSAGEATERDAPGARAGPGLEVEGADDWMSMLRPPPPDADAGGAPIAAATASTTSSNISRTCLDLLMRWDPRGSLRLAAGLPAK